MICEICGGVMKYMGIVDGCGDYGNQICEEWECAKCGLVESIGYHDGKSWHVQAVDEIIADEDDDDDTREFYPF